MHSTASEDPQMFGSSLCVRGEIFIIMSSFTLLRKVFSMKKKPSNVRMNRGEGTTTKRLRVTENVSARCNIKCLHVCLATIFRDE